MKTPGAHYPSPLGRMQAIPMDIEATKRQGWADQHILVIAQDDARLSFIERELIRSIGERLYGSQRPGRDNHHGHSGHGGQRGGRHG